ncbi:MAG: TldD/PmbA family protein [Oscillatoria sp. SIO1A7]|nr:TldD/PmbA family protein [Oscillatoria sp. SIO1A7]
MIPSYDRALSLVDTAIQQSQAEGVFVTLSAGEEALSRFSENQMSQNVSTNRLKLTVASYFGKRCASASTTELEPEAIAQAIRRSEDLARIAPEDPEWVPLLEPQSYESRRAAFDEATATMSPLERGEIVREGCDRAARVGATASGTFSNRVSLLAIGNSLGLRACGSSTEADFSYTIRIDNGSSWSNRTAWSASQLPIEEISERTIERALASRNPREIPPGVYPVVFDNAAFATLLPFIIWSMDARAADEGRSFMSRTDESGQPAGNRVGEEMFSPLVQVQRHPAHPLLQKNIFFDDGLGNRYLELIQDGVPQTLSYSRYWAQEQNQEPTGYFYPIAMAGSEQSLSDIVAQTERGILVSRAWYVRYLNPRSLEVTGMTRDGTFLIEDGRIACPIKNLRFNQSLPDMLRDIDALSSVQRFGGLVVPGVRVKAFNFSSVTDSV